MILQIVYIILKNKIWRTMTTPELKLDELLEGFFRKEDNYEVGKITLNMTLNHGKVLSRPITTIISYNNIIILQLLLIFNLICNLIRKKHQLINYEVIANSMM